MTVGIGQNIEATDFNSIYNKFYNVFGKGSIDSGYGQVASGITNNISDIISADTCTRLRHDMIRARQHQTGMSVNDSAAMDGMNLLPIIPGDFIDDALMLQYDNFANIVDVNKHSVHPSQYTKITTVNATRVTPWNGRVTHTIEISSSSIGDGSYDNLRYFFNAGGKLEFFVSRDSGPVTAKNIFWTQLLASIGLITFDYAITTKTGNNGIANPIGFYSLTTTDQIIFSISGLDTYSPNYFSILARTNSAKSKIIFSVIFADDLTEAPVDHNISGALTSIFTQYVPSGMNVDVPQLTAIHYGLNDNIAKTVYAASSNVTRLNEGDSCIISVGSSDITSGTIYWNTVGNVNGLDFTDGQLSGSLDIIDGGGSLIRTLVNDKMTEIPDEYFTIEFRANSSTGILLAKTKTIYINDTSKYELTVSATSVDEGSSINYTITSTNIANGTVLYITLAANVTSLDISGGFTVLDIVNGFTNRTVTIQNTTASGSISIATDWLYENPELFTIQARINSPTGNIVATSPIVTIIDKTPTFHIVATHPAVIVSNSVISYTITSNYAVNGTILYITMLGDFKPTDVVGGVTQMVTVQNNLASSAFTLSGFTNYGDKVGYLLVQVVSFSGQVAGVSNRFSMKGKGKISFHSRANSYDYSEDFFIPNITTMRYSWHTSVTTTATGTINVTPNSKITAATFNPAYMTDIGEHSDRIIATYHPGTGGTAAIAAGGAFYIELLTIDGFYSGNYVYTTTLHDGKELQGVGYAGYKIDKLSMDIETIPAVSFTTTGSIDNINTILGNKNDFHVELSQYLPDLGSDYPPVKLPTAKVTIHTIPEHLRNEVGLGIFGWHASQFAYRDGADLTAPMRTFNDGQTVRDVRPFLVPTTIINGHRYINLDFTGIPATDNPLLMHPGVPIHIYALVNPLVTLEWG